MNGQRMTTRLVFGAFVGAACLAGGVAAVAADADYLNQAAHSPALTAQIRAANLAPMDVASQIRGLINESAMPAGSSVTLMSPFGPNHVRVSVSPLGRSVIVGAANGAQIAAWQVRQDTSETERGEILKAVADHLGLDQGVAAPHPRLSDQAPALRNKAILQPAGVTTR
ncbi:MAG TPA: hypothetical protein DCL48_10275 [Alphaproteobacteria bacterium]|nr:hypothetical protein [Alphaproteobacteria bacterium]